MTAPRRLIVAITGATGTVFGVRLLEMLQETDVESHLIMSRWAARTLVLETSYTVEQVEALATRVVPCSMRTLAAIAHGLGDNLIHRAADVILKERRKLVLAVREAPLSDIHLENMLKLSRMGVVICPPMPAFYNKPQSLDDLVNYTAARLLDQLGIHLDVRNRWTGMRQAGAR